MSVRNLDKIFEPRSVAVIGASTTAGSVGNMIVRNLLNGGFEGPIFPINPRHPSVEGLKAYPSVQALTTKADLAVICTPAATIPGLISELGAQGTRAAVVVSGSGSEDQAGAAQWRQKILDAARPNLLRIIGPNCLGVLSPPCLLNASFAHIAAGAGDIAFVSQSGALLTTLLDWAEPRRMGFSRLVSLGDMSDVDFGDMLDFLAVDRQTKAVFLYVEAVTQARKFMSAARACARLKPVIVIKAGRHGAAAKAAQSHTGALAGSDAVYDAAFRRAGVLRVENLQSMFDALEAITLLPSLNGDRLAIVTNGGGMGVVATDTLLDRQGSLANLSDDTIARLNAILPAHWSHGNPVDLIGDAGRQRYESALEAVLQDPGVDCTLVIHCPVAVASGEDCAQGVIAASRAQPKPLMTNWLGARAPVKARDILRGADLPTFDTPDDAVTGFMNVADYRKVQKNLMEVPPALPSGFRPDAAAARQIIHRALTHAESWLSPADVSGVLEAYQIPFVRSAVAKSIEGIADAARGMSFPLALKIQSPDILHKSDAGGVMLDLHDLSAAIEAARVMRENIARSFPAARLDGFLLQEMASRPHARELILGMAVDPTFGPVLLVGHGGTAVEVINDKAIGLPPLNLRLAEEMLSKTRVYRQLQGYRDHPPADIGAVLLTLVKLSQLAIDQDAIAEIDINPLLVNESGVLCVDARIRVAPPGRRASQRLAICPYPAELEKTKHIPGVGDFQLRAVRPDDADQFGLFADSLSGEDVRLRFMSVKRALLPDELARLTQIDYDREMALLLLEASTGRIAGVARLVCDPEIRNAEFAVIVRSDLKQKGLGTLLMQTIVDYGRQKGLQTIFGEILRENTAMLALSRKLGFVEIQQASSAQQVHVTKTLDS